MKRRAFMGLVGGAAVWPLMAGAQQKRKWRIGFLHPGQSTLVANRISALREGLGKAGSAEDFEILARIANDRPDQLPAMAADLVKEGVHAICAVAPLAVTAARATTRSVPIIALDLESDPIANGWATSLAHPGGNITGIFLDLPEFSAKSLQLLREVVPGGAKIGVLWHPASGTLQLYAARQSAAALSVELQVFKVDKVAEFEAAFNEMAQAQISGLLMLSAPVVSGNPKLLSDLAIRNRIPTINIFPDFAQNGGLIGYGPELQSLFAQAGFLIGKVIGGAAVSDLPVERPTRFKLIANLKTARLIGVTMPTSVLLLADEIIE
ncbi:ABC transporter substrate-binding protein [Bradyrhizobium sp. OAE829]|uniref:ABC transporter substrate-binding protein n=1 Tax=Bradyrhizobium sp. OAE829 TaxID=2663807 RepID=UPI00178A50AA